MRADNPSQSLRKAVKAGSLPKVLAALALGGDPAAPGSSGRTALQIAQSRGHQHLLASLSQARSAPPKAPSGLETEAMEQPFADSARQFPPSRPHGPSESFALAPAIPAPATSIWEEMALRSDGFGPLPVRLSPGRARIMR